MLLAIMIRVLQKMLIKLKVVLYLAILIINLVLEKNQLVNFLKIQDQIAGILYLQMNLLKLYF